MREFQDTKGQMAAWFSHYVSVVHLSLIYVIKSFILFRNDNSDFSAIAAVMTSLFVQRFAYEYEHNF